MTRKILDQLVTELTTAKNEWFYKRALRKFKPPEESATTEMIKQVYESANLQYACFQWLYDQMLPMYMRNHRDYFAQDQRGFGEDAFHAMWFLIFQEYRPGLALEIGVYRGQVISLWSLMAKHMSLNTEVHGISPFTAQGDQVSNYVAIDYYSDVVSHFKHFGLSEPFLHTGLSTDETMIDVVISRSWDLIYVDGSHDYETVKHDCELCGRAIKPGGLVVLDDASLYNGFTPPRFSFAGHPGPSRVAENMSSEFFQEIVTVGHNRVFQRKK